MWWGRSPRSINITIWVWLAFSISAACASESTAEQYALPLEGPVGCANNCRYLMGVARAALEQYRAVARGLELLIVQWLSLLATTMKRMADSKLWTAEELERLSAAERNEIIRAGIVTDLEDVPPAFLDRVRANVHDHISTSEPAATTER